MNDDHQKYFLKEQVLLTNHHLIKGENYEK